MTLEERKVEALEDISDMLARIVECIECQCGGCEEELDECDDPNCSCHEFCNERNDF